MAKNKASKKILFIAGAVLCCIFALMLVCNLTIIIKGVINPETPPSVFGVTPMVVQSGSMSGSAEDHIEVGDLIFTVKPNTAELKKGDITSFMEGDIAVTHRIVDVQLTQTVNAALLPRATPTIRKIRQSVRTLYSDCIRGVFRGWEISPCSCKSRWVWRYLSAYRCALLSSTTLSAAREAPAERIRKPRSLNPSLNGSVPLREKRTPKKKTAAKHNKRYLPRNRCHSRTKR